jgi:hypothetical protein
MDRVEEIEAAITALPPEEYGRIVQWFRAREQTRWDEQMDRDSSAGKLDFLFQEADTESAPGLVREWPPRR